MSPRVSTPYQFSSQSDPPLAPGVVLLEQYIEHDTVVRKERVSCTYERCPHQSEDHDVWYTYRQEGDHWISSYWGLTKPKVKPRPTSDYLASILSELADPTQRVPFERLNELSDVVARLAPDRAPYISDLKKKAYALLEAHQHYREERIQDRHDSLLSRQVRGEVLSSDEENELDRTTSMLLADH